MFNKLKRKKLEVLLLTGLALSASAVFAEDPQLSFELSGYEEGATKQAKTVSVKLAVSEGALIKSAAVQIYLNGVRVCSISGQSAIGKTPKSEVSFKSKKILNRLDECTANIKVGNKVETVLARATAIVQPKEGAERIVLKEEKTINVNISGNQSANLAPCSPRIYAGVNGLASADVFASIENKDNKLVFSRENHGVLQAPILAHATHTFNSYHPTIRTNTTSAESYRDIPRVQACLALVGPNGERHSIEYCARTEMRWDPVTEASNIQRYMDGLNEQRIYTDKTTAKLIAFSVNGVFLKGPANQIASNIERQGRDYARNGVPANMSLVRMPVAMGTDRYVEKLIASNLEASQTSVVVDTAIGSTGFYCFDNVVTAPAILSVEGREIAPE